MCVCVGASVSVCVRVCVHSEQFMIKHPSKK